MGSRWSALRRRAGESGFPVVSLGHWPGCGLHPWTMSRPRCTRDERRCPSSSAAARSVDRDRSITVQRPLSGPNGRSLPLATRWIHPLLEDPTAPLSPTHAPVPAMDAVDSPDTNARAQWRPAHRQSRTARNTASLPGARGFRGGRSPCGSALQPHRFDHQLSQSGAEATSRSVLRVRHLRPACAAGGLGDGATHCSCLCRVAA